MTTIDPEIDQVHRLAAAASVVITHQKFESLPGGAAWLWLQGLVYAKDHHGDIHARAVKTWPGARYAEKLVEVGLWRTTESGWRLMRLSAKAPTPVAKPAQNVEQKTIVMEFECVNGTWALTDEKLTQLTQAFPALDVRDQILKAKAWIALSPKNRKTVGGMGNFLFNWLARTNDKRRRPDDHGTPAGRTGAAPTGKYAARTQHG